MKTPIRTKLAAAVATAPALILACTLGAAFNMAHVRAEAAEVKIGRFPPLAAIESVLRRGASREAVRSALGEPSGFGDTRMPPAHAPRETWYYEDLEIEDATRRGEFVYMNLRHQILLIFFDGDRVDGYLWTSNRGKAEAK